MTSDDTTKEAAIYMLRKGVATVNEVAKLAGRSHQIVRIWAMKYPDARAEYLKAQWAKALARKRS